MLNHHAQSPSHLVYNAEYDCYINNVRLSNNDTVGSFISVRQCKSFYKGEIQVNKKCLCNTEAKQRLYAWRVFSQGPDRVLINGTDEEIGDSINPMAKEQLTIYRLAHNRKALNPIRLEPNPQMAKSINRVIDRAHARVIPEEIKVGSRSVNVPLMCKIHNILSSTAKCILRILGGAIKICSAILVLLGLLTAIPLLGSLTGGMWKAWVSPSHIDGQLHPSGDYKTVRSKPTQLQRATRLLAPTGDISDEIFKTTDTQLESIRNKVASNVVFMIGIKYLPDEPDAFERYPVRCLGIKNRELLVLKHYIDHFKSLNIEDVCFVWPNNSATFSCKLLDLKFRWCNNGGYGICYMPSAVRQFKNIVKYFPTESVSSFASQGQIMEVTRNWEQRLECMAIKRIQKPIHVPGNRTQTAWTIENGFEYPFGGSGKCGSLLFSPNLATPLVGIHTAGLREMKYGYAEALTRETFESDEITVDYIVPEM